MRDKRSTKKNNRINEHHKADFQNTHHLILSSICKQANFRCIYGMATSSLHDINRTLRNSVAVYYIYVKSIEFTGNMSIYQSNFIIPGHLLHISECFLLRSIKKHKELFKFSGMQIKYM